MPEPYHQPVLLDEVCAALSPSLSPKENSAGASHETLIYVDGTCGGAGHASAILDRTGVQRLLLLDRDPDALAYSRPHILGHAEASPDLRISKARIEFCHTPFASVASALEERDLHHVNAILVDLGVSSHQLDLASRGFSFQGDGPLDMRMDSSGGESAGALLARVSHAELRRILSDYGDENDAPRIATAILAAKPQTTHALALVVTHAMSGRQRRKLGLRIHPATRTFQALRIAVNGELDQLDAFLEIAPSLLAPGGRLAVISFHSLEDRRVKRRFRTLTRVEALPRHIPMTAEQMPQSDYVIPKGFAKAVAPSADECRANPRARSARLRVLERRP